MVRTHAPHCHSERSCRARTERRRSRRIPFTTAGPASLHPRLCLISLNQIADTLRIPFAVAMTGDGIGPAGGFDDNLRPKHTGVDVYRRDLRHSDTFFVAAEQSRLHARNPLRAD